MKPSRLDCEMARVQALRQYNILDTDPEATFDDITRLAAHICETPIALINLIDENRQWFKSKIGWDLAEIPRYMGICPWLIQEKQPVVIPDTLTDERTKDNPGCASFRFYAGAPLITPEGQAIGTLCAIDYVPKILSAKQIEALQALSRQAIDQLELRRHLANVELSNLEHQQVMQELTRISKAIESTSDAIGIADMSGRSIYHNQAFIQLYGYTVDDLNAEGYAPAMFVQPKVAEAVFAAIQNGQSWSGEVELKAKSGRIIPTLLRADCIIDDSGKRIGLIGVCSDITEKKQAEKALKARLCQQAAVAELGQQALAGLDLSILMERALIQVAQCLEVEYSKVLELLPAGDALLLRAGVGWKEGLVGHATVGIDRSSQAGYTLLCDRPVVVEDIRTETRFNSPPLLQEHGAIGGLSLVIPCQNDQNRPWGILGAHTTQRRQFTQDDINFLQAIANVLATAIQRKRAEEQQRQSEERFQLVARATNDAIWDWNLVTHQVWWNEGVQTIFYYPAAEVGTDISWWAECIHPEERQRVVSSIHEAIDSDAEFWLDEYRFRRGDGSYAYVADRGYILRDEAGKAVRMIGGIGDISDRKQTETLLRERQEALVQKEALLRNVLDTIPIGVWIADGQGLIVRTNPATQRIWGGVKYVGLDRYEEYKGWWADTGQPITSHDWGLARAITKGETSLNEYIEIEAFDGTRKTILNSAIPLRNNSQEIIGAIVLNQDITEQRLVEKALWENQRLIQQIADSTPVILYLYDLIEQRNIYANRQMAETLGYSPEELQEMGSTFLPMLIHPEDWPILTEHLKCLHTAKDGEVFENEYRLQHANGEWRWLYVRHTVFSRTAEGCPHQILGTSLDITERKLGQEKIHEQAALLDVTSDAIILRDRESKILFWNKGAERLYGWTAEEVLGQNFNHILFKNVTPELREALKTLTEKDEWQGELRQVTKDGKEVIVASRWTLMRDEREKPKSILMVNTDITEKQKLEAQFLRAQRMESIGALAGGVAHDLNNVLAPILMAIQLLGKKIPDPQSQRLLNTIETNAKRGADLIKQVLSFARGMENKLTIVQIRHLISEIQQVARQTFPKSIEFSTDIPRDLWTLSGDATQLHQVLMNLVVNARDAMPNGGTLSISAENIFLDQNYAQMDREAQAGPYIAITVSDSGTGIAPEIIDRIFEPFFTTKELGKGTGLGLSTTIGIVKSHGGFVKVHSQVGKGTQFKVYLPAVKDPEIPLLEDIELPTGQGELLLVVDDEAAIREIAKTSLETYGYRVLTASDGIEAVAIYVQNREEIRVVLTNMMMPSMDGQTTIRMLRKINPQVKVIATSGMISSEKICLADSPGIKTFLAKPYTAKELLQTIHLVMNNGS